MHYTKTTDTMPLGNMCTSQVVFFLHLQVEGWERAVSLEFILVPKEKITSPRGGRIIPLSNFIFDDLVLLMVN